MRYKGPDDHPWNDELNCGCKTERREGWSDPVVIFCPLHTAAEEMRNLLDSLVKGKGQTHVGHIRKQARALLAKVRP